MLAAASSCCARGAGAAGGVRASRLPLAQPDGASPSAIPGVIDFQDAVRGPVGYDLVSLLKDCYIAWPRARVVGWVLRYRALARRAAASPAGASEAQFLRWFDLIGVQRHIKVLGIFCAPVVPRRQGRISRTTCRCTLDYVRRPARATRELRRLRRLPRARTSRPRCRAPTRAPRRRRRNARMKAMVLAAGRGERMRPLTDHTAQAAARGGRPAADRLAPGGAGARRRHATW